MKMGKRRKRRKTGKKIRKSNINAKDKKKMGKNKERKMQEKI